MAQHHYIPVKTKLLRELFVTEFILQLQFSDVPAIPK